MQIQDTKPLLEARNLSVTFGEQTVLHSVNLQLGPDEVLGIVGETGAGKSVLARALIGLLPGKGQVSGGTVQVAGRDLSQMSAEELRKLRGGQVSLIGTDAKSLLDQVGDKICIFGFSRGAYTARALAGMIQKVLRIEFQTV